MIFSWTLDAVGVTTCSSVGLEINYGSLAGATIAQRNFPNVHLICGDGLRLPLSDSSIDKILLSGTFQSVQNDRQLLCECNRVLKPNGIIVITVISQHVLAKRIHSGRIYESFKRWYRQEKLVTRYYGKAELSKIFLETGFRIVNAKYAPNQLASAVLDLLNFISFRTGLHFNQRYIFLAFYPLLWLIEKFSKNTQQGNELIVSAKKGIATQ